MAKDVYILGVGFNRFSFGDVGHDPAAALLKNGRIVAMAEEERFNRVKEAPGYFPTRAVQFCLKSAGIEIENVEAIGWNWNPFAHAARSIGRRSIGTRVAMKGVQAMFARGPLESYSRYLPVGMFPKRSLRMHEQMMRHALRVERIPQFIPVDHHLAHAASAYYPSGFNEATVVTWDGYGDELSGMICHGRGDKLEILEELLFSRFSIGHLYDAIYRVLGLSEKGNLMGLAGYGTPRGLLDPLVDVPSLRMKMDWIQSNGAPGNGLLGLIGRRRAFGEPLSDHHRTVAADLQDVIERFGREIVRRATAQTSCRRVCFAGGVALNATMNGKLHHEGLVDEMFIQPGAGDAGGALGAAYVAHASLGHTVGSQEMKHAYWGSEFTVEEIREILANVRVSYEEVTDAAIPELVSDLLVEGNIVGWFRGRTEFGPRALGARSILGDPRKRAMRDKINAAVKYRDEWRPFAASMLADAAADYLVSPCPAPFMIVTFPVRAERTRELEAVLHVDGTTRPQLVEKEANPVYYETIRRFGEKTGVPAILNTSFNLKGEPLVNSPLDALRTFFSSGIDVLVLERLLVRKSAPSTL
jgi:carbamoyltransferase